MLRVDVVYVPAGDHTREERIGSIGIANITGLAPISDYLAWLLNDPHGVIISKHRRTDGWLPLVARALTALANQN